MLFTKKYKKRLADAEKELKETKQELKETKQELKQAKEDFVDLKQSIKSEFEKLNEAISKRYIHEQDKEEERYSVSQIVDEWLNGESKEGDD